MKFNINFKGEKINKKILPFILNRNENEKFTKK